MLRLPPAFLGRFLYPHWRAGRGNRDPASAWRVFSVDGDGRLPYHSPMTSKPHPGPDQAVAATRGTTVASRAERRRQTLVARMTQALAASLPAKRIGVAVSGGADSVALLRLLALVARDHPLALVVLHVDHGLRPDSRAEARWVGRLARHLGLPCQVRHLDPPPTRPGAGGGLEAWARTHRLRSLAEMAAAADLPWVALGHHAGDQAETVLLRLLRGTSLSGLAGMRSRRTLRWPGGVVRLWRPFLEVTRQDLRQVLEELGQDWQEDPTNTEPRFLRNRIRQEVLPLLESIRPGAARHLGALAHDVHLAMRALSPRKRQSSVRMEPRPDRTTKCSSTLLGSEVGRAFPAASLPTNDFLLAERLRRWLIRLGLGTWVTRSLLRRLTDLARRHQSGRQVAVGNRLVVRTHAGLELVSRKAPSLEPLNGDLRPEGQVEGSGYRFLLTPRKPAPKADGCWIPADLAADGLQVRHRRPGDRFRPAGAAGGKKLGRWLTDRKIPRHERNRLVLVTRGAEVLWITGLARSSTTRDRPAPGFLFLGRVPLGPATPTSKPARKPGGGRTRAKPRSG